MLHKLKCSFLIVEFHEWLTIMAMRLATFWCVFNLRFRFHLIHWALQANLFFCFCHHGMVKIGQFFCHLSMIQVSFDSSMLDGVLLLFSSDLVGWLLRQLSFVFSYFFSSFEASRSSCRDRSQSLSSLALVVNIYWTSSVHLEKRKSYLFRYEILSENDWFISCI